MRSMRKRKTFLRFCSYDGCKRSFNVRQDALKAHSGLCRVHSHVKRPFESIYNRLRRDWRNTKVELTYKEFVKFTKTKYCHYCGDKIQRSPFATVEGSFLSSAYFLDRKNNDKPYSKSNCVVCCTECNRIKGNRFSYKEFLILAKGLLEIRFNRQKNERNNGT